MHDTEDKQWWVIEWAKKELGLEVPESALSGVTQEKAREVLWNAFDQLYRPDVHDRPLASRGGPPPERKQ